MASPWMPGVDSIVTQAQGPRRGITPTAVVSHVMQGYQLAMIQWARETPPINRKSAHFTIGRTGYIAQHVALDQAAWTSGFVNQPSWHGIRYLNGAPVNPNLYTVNIEHEGFSVPPGYGYDYVYDNAHPWPEAMIDASIKVHEYVFNYFGWGRFALAERVITHSMIDSVNRKNDPGALWLSAVRPQITKALLPAPVPAKPPETLSPPLRKDDAPALFQLAYGYQVNGVTVRPLPLDGATRRYEVRLP